MKILNLRFKNLNSLVGEWSIDLTHQAYAGEGIFAITGPTGAGKTTILDAICLALYGRTPRLSKVTKSGNEVLSRQCGECFAEVTFATPAGRFRCHWSQHRARKRAEGELQAPKHEIVNADSGQVLETKIVDVARRIEAVSGMDFERFTRSMLLAQGGFAVFLQAAPDERAPILEQITGTEIYSRISIAVHERRSAERKLLENLTAELAGLTPLSAADEHLLQTALAEKCGRDEAVTKEIVEQNRILAWFDAIVRLEQEQLVLAEQQQDWQLRWTAFAPEQEQLLRAMRALELAADHAVLMSLRREQLAELQQLTACQAELPVHEVLVLQAEAAADQMVGQLGLCKVEQQEAALVIRTVRELDLKCAEKERLIATLVAGVAGQEQSLAELRARHGADCADLDLQRKTVTALDGQLAATAADAALVETLAVLCDRFTALEELQARQSEGLAAVTSSELQVKEALTVWESHLVQLETQQHALADCDTLLSRKQHELEQILAGRDLADWRQHSTAMTEQLVQLDKLIAAIQIHGETVRLSAELQQRQSLLVDEQSHITAELVRRCEQHTTLEREVGLLETQLLLLRKITDFEEARRQLAAGEPCPLCGSLEHPYACGTLPAPEATALLLTERKDELKTVREAITAVQVKQSALNKDQEHLSVRQQENHEKSKVAAAEIHQYRATVACTAPGLDSEEQLPLLRRNCAEQLETALRVVKSAEALVQDIAQLRDRWERARELVVAAERESQSALHRRESAEKEHVLAAAAAALLADQLQQAVIEAGRDVAVYGVETLSIQTLGQVRSLLTDRRDQWLERLRNKAAVEQRITGLDVTIRHQGGQIDAAVTDLTKQRQQLQELGEESAALSRQRKELFADGSVDAEESRLAAAVEAAEQRCNEARQSLYRTQQELGTLRSGLAQLTRATEARAAAVTAAEKEFTQRFTGLGFMDETDYLTACLPDGVREALRRRSQELTAGQAALKAMVQEKETVLAEERRRQVSNKSRMVHGENLAALAVEQKALQQEIGGIRQRLHDNNVLQQRLQERLQVIEAQQRECRRWDLLHELIGSADGKKYRNFAQGLTFELMINHANRQLAKMSDRYMLVRDVLHPLELNVLDNYQAGEIRSTKNLSGGESFIVSLALALGLSQMASKHVRVDSLFLDEGFGTLDDEALDTALETLAGLRQDGKLIGVISHVAALKERIASQIQVVPLTGGRSSLSGPGVTRG